MTIEKTVADRAKILADFQQLRTEIEARKPSVGNYVLRWFYEGSSLYVSRYAGSAVGFNRASMFDDRKAAIDYLRNTGIRNGRGDAPGPVKATEAKQGALDDLDACIATLAAMED